MQSSVPALVKFAVYRVPADDDINLDAEGHLEHATVTDCLLSLAAYEYPGAHSDGSTFNLEKPTELELVPSNQSQVDYRYVYEVVGIDHVSTTELAVSGYDIATIQSYFMSNMISTKWMQGEGLHNTDYGISAALIGDVDLEARFAGMADSMTTYLRSRPDALKLTGYTVVEKVFVHIQWYWLAGPVIMDLAAVLLALSTIISNRRNRYPPWKSSTLAMLACSHDEDDQVIRSRVKNIKDIETFAKNCSVKLV